METDEVRLGEERISNFSSTDFPGHRAEEEEDAAWDLNGFRKRARIEVKRLTSDAIDFDLVGVDTSVANALRRCLIAEVPTVAVKTAFIQLNTSLVQDEVLAHRLAFVPLNVHPSLLAWRRRDQVDATDATTVVLGLEVRCSHRRGAAEGEQDPEKLYENAHVYSKAIVWDPKGSQEADWAAEGHAPPAPVLDDILIAKLRPGQEISLELHCELGRGSDHAKYSPVATASYRLMPTIHLREPIPPALCEKFASCFSPGVVRVTGKGEKRQARVVNPRADTVSREVLRHPEFKDKLPLLMNLVSKKGVYKVSIESTGTYEPDELLPAAINEMLQRVKVLRTALERLEITRRRPQTPSPPDPTLHVAIESKTKCRFHVRATTTRRRFYVMSDTSSVGSESPDKKRSQNEEEHRHEDGSSAHYVPLAFALVPPLGALFHGRSETWADGMILLLVAFYLYQLHRVPWMLYYEARQQRPALQIDDRMTPSERRELVAAQTELRRYEIMSLLGTIAAPAIGAATLYGIRTHLSEPDRFINTFNVRLYLLASGVKPLLHISRLIRGRVGYLSEDVRRSKMPNGDLRDRLAFLEKEIALLRQQSATKSDVRILRDGLDAPLAQLYKNLRKAERKEELMLLTFGERFSLLDAKVDRALGNFEDGGSPRPTKLLLPSDINSGALQSRNKNTAVMRPSYSLVFFPVRLMVASLWWIKRISTGA